ncbi:MAG TPA: alpha/beta hydrolase [Gammaproteobacteria bacterium]
MTSRPTFSKSSSRFKPRRRPRDLFRSELGKKLIQHRYLTMLRDAPVRCEQLRLPTRQGETFVLAAGPAEAPTVVLFHGGGITSAMWLRSMAVWSATRRVYAVDIIGEPGLSAPSRPRLISDAHARWLDDVWRGLSLSTASVVAASLGGWVALDYAIRRPAHVERLALLAPAGIGRQRLGTLYKIMPLLYLGRWGRRKALDIVMAFDPQEAASPEGRQLVELAELVLQHFKFRNRPFPLFKDEQLRRLTMPVLVVLGGRDAAIDSEQTRRRLASCVPHAEVRYLPEAGHALTDQTATIAEFLARRAGGDATGGD